MSTTFLNSVLPQAVAAVRPFITGSVTAVTGMTAWVEGVSAPVGDVLRLATPAGQIQAEVIAAVDGRLACMPMGPLSGLGPGVPVSAGHGPLHIDVGAALLGRVLDGLGRPIDGRGPLHASERVPVDNAAPAPLTRQRIDRQIGLGVRAIDALTPVGRGQRLGIFAGSGVGKSTLLSMIARGTTADVVVAALVGERGREVREFLENDLGEEGLRRSVMVVATSDQPSVVRLRAAFVATRIAEWFRDQGADVLLLMDSVTRTAFAQREVGLSAGEPPATRGYPPSVFGLLPKLMERAGASDRGTITALYTVLVEGDDIHDPIGDTARSILDGHIVLDRALATSGHYPSIDVLGSVSRVVSAITDRSQRADATELRRLLAAYRDSKVLLEIGAYVPGSDPVVDRARQLMPAIDAFLRQDVDEVCSIEETWTRLHAVVTS